MSQFAGQSIMSTEDLMREIDERLGKIQADGSPMQELPTGVEPDQHEKSFEDDRQYGSNGGESDLEAASMIDKIEQKMNGGIKPMDDQFPGSKDLSEKKLSFQERCDKKLMKLAAATTYKGVVIDVISDEGKGFVATFLNGHSTIGKTKEEAIAAAKKAIDQKRSAGHL